MAIMAEVEPEVRELGLELKELFLLGKLDDHPHPADLARALITPKPSITFMVKRMEAAGFVERADGGGRLAALSPHAHPLGAQGDGGGPGHPRRRLRAPARAALGERARRAGADPGAAGGRARPSTLTAQVLPEGETDQLRAGEDDGGREAEQRGEADPGGAVDQAAHLAEGALGEGDVALHAHLALQDGVERARSARRRTGSAGPDPSGGPCHEVDELGRGRAVAACRGA